MKKYRLDTIAVHGGQRPDPTEFSVGLPIHRTSAYAYKSAEHAKTLFDLNAAGNIYTRLGNPTMNVLEERLTQLEGGAAAVSAASGMAAVFNTVVNLARAGDEIIACSNLYGGTFTLFDAILPQLGVKCKMVPLNDEDALDAAVTEKSRMIYVETIGNPGLDVADLELIAKVAQKHHLPLVVDSTFTTPALLRPFEHGANIIIHSCSKWIGGHG
ncbi:MAG: O-acetylhomoserine aminocarboxypropyltransferase/cysteine synthase, partial [Desulfovibrionaceae bacterium]|nr:O-acetylhomoserine aminocarboxypropyltransferase/cysteine synthase [Desulfovibrionaceae bacterium]